MYFFDCIQRGSVVCGKVKRGTVRFAFGTRSNSPPPHFLILKLFIRCLLVEVREWLGVGICLCYKILNGSKLVYFLEESSMPMNFLAPETSHIMALKIKDCIISSLLLAHHYLRLIDRWTCPKPEGTPEQVSWYIMVDSC